MYIAVTPRNMVHNTTGEGLCIILCEGTKLIGSGYTKVFLRRAPHSVYSINFQTWWMNIKRVNTCP